MANKAGKGYHSVCKNLGNEREMTAEKTSQKTLSEFFNIVGANIIRLRTGAGMSQKELATKAGAGRSTILAIESGRRCNLTMLIKIACALGVSPADLFLTPSDHREITYKTKLLVEKITEVLNLK